MQRYNPFAVFHSNNYTLDYSNRKVAVDYCYCYCAVLFCIVWKPPVKWSKDMQVCPQPVYAHNRVNNPTCGVPYHRLLGASDIATELYFFRTAFTFAFTPKLSEHRRSWPGAFRWLDTPINKCVKGREFAFIYCARVLRAIRERVEVFVFVMLRLWYVVSFVFTPII